MDHLAHNVLITAIYCGGFIGEKTVDLSKLDEHSFSFVGENTIYLLRTISLH